MSLDSRSGCFSDPSMVDVGPQDCIINAFDYFLYRMGIGKTLFGSFMIIFIPAMANAQMVTPGRPPTLQILLIRHVAKRYTIDFETLGSNVSYSGVKTKVTRTR